MQASEKSITLFMTIISFNSNLFVAWLVTSAILLEGCGPCHRRLRYYSAERLRVAVRIYGIADDYAAI
jgi:hypothetical protein